MAVLCLAAVLGILFFKSFLSGIVHFSNDGPLGALHADWWKPWPNFTGMWIDLYWIGQNAGSLAVDLNSIFGFLGPVGYSKFLQPLSLFFLGISAYVFFRQLKLSPALAIVAALAAALNMNFFSNVCWGLGTRGLTLGWIFLALAVSAKPNGGIGWLRIVLAGLAVGMAVIEGADNGAIFSLYVGTYLIYWALVEEGVSFKPVSKGVARAVIVAVFAGFIAAQAIISLVGTQIQSVAGMHEEQQSKEKTREQIQQEKDAKWNWATQWSLPKAETLRVLIPGIYGYRMDGSEGAAYWGRVGQSEGYEQSRQGIARFSGAGEYAGVLVLLIALWALAEARRRNGSAFDEKERKLILFWGVAALISLLLAWGRFAPFYQFIYALPYFSTIRNPMKFMHPFHMCVMILFAYGLLGLSRRYLETAQAKSASAFEQLKIWWSKAPLFEKRWTYASLATIGVSVLGFLVYSSKKAALQQYLSTDFGGLADPISRFSINEVGFYIVFLLLSVAMLTLIMSGAFSGKRARWGIIVLGAILVIDMARANAPWIKFYDYEDKYATNPIVDTLRQKPYEHRVVLPPMSGGREWSMLQQVYMVEWIQHHFPYYNIQTIDVSQEPRMPADKLAYRTALAGNIGRLWQLTNTRYVLGMVGSFLDTLNQQADPGKNRFKIVSTFNLGLKREGEQLTSLEQLTAVTNAQGPYALFEFTGALPRAKLYSQWQVNTNDHEILKQLADPAFDPAAQVLISGSPGTVPSPAPTTQDPGTVEITKYAPKKIQLDSKSQVPTVLLLNDRYDSGWKVSVDNQPAQLLRANFTMRGVYLPAGNHSIQFSFEPPVKGLYVTLAGIALGVLLSGVLALFTCRSPREQKANPAVTAQQPT